MLAVRPGRCRGGRPSRTFLSLTASRGAKVSPSARQDGVGLTRGRNQIRRPSALPPGPLCHLALGIKSTSPGKRWAGGRACMLSRVSHVRFFVTPWTGARQAPLSMGFSRQEHWSGLPCPPPGDLPDPGIEPATLVSLALQAVSLPLASPGKPGSRAALRKRKGQKMWETKAPLTYSITLTLSTY